MKIFLEQLQQNLKENSRILAILQISFRSKEVFALSKTVKNSCSLSCQNRLQQKVFLEGSLYIPKGCTTASPQSLLFPRVSNPNSLGLSS